MKKALKIMLLSVTAMFAMLTFTNISFGSTMEPVTNFLRDHSEIMYAAVSPHIALENYAGKYDKKLFSTLTNDMEVWGDITPHTMLKSKFNMTKLTIGDGARPYAGGQEDTTDEALKYTGLVLEVETGQRDFAIEIEKYKGQYLEEFGDPEEGSSATKEKIPFAEYTYNKVFEKLRSELNDKTAYHGFDRTEVPAFDSGDTYAVGDKISFVEGTLTNYYQCTAVTTAGQSPTTHSAKWKKVNAEAICPGFGHRLAGLITAGKVTPLNIGAIDNENVFAYAAHTQLFRSHATQYKRMGVVHYCSWTDFELLLDDLEDKVAKYTEKDTNWVDGRGIYLPKTNKKCLVLPCTWMDNSRRIISTPKANLHGGTDKTSDLNKIAVRKQTNYITVSSIKFVLGFQIQDPEALRTNDQV